MPFAVSLPPAAASPSSAVELVRQATRWGYDAAWASEVAGPDFATVLAAVAVGVDADIELGVAVAPVQTRAPWLLAATAASLADLSGGRFSLGLGTSSEVIIEQWSGLTFDQPLARLRANVEAIRSWLAGERFNGDSELLSTHGYRLPAAPTDPVPIVVGALNPKSLRQAGEIGDGVCLNQLGPQHVPMVLEEVRAGATAAGRDLDSSYQVIARLFCWVTDDPTAARAQLRRTFTPYVATLPYNRFYRWLGFEREARGVLDALEAGDRAGAAAALSDELLDTVVAVGDADQVAATVQAYMDGGVTTPVIACPSPVPEDTPRTLEAIGSRLR